MRGGGRLLLLLLPLHDCEEGCFLFIVWTNKGLWGAEVNVGAQGCWSAGVHSQEGSVALGDDYLLFFACKWRVFIPSDDCRCLTEEGSAQPAAGWTMMY